MIFTSKPLFFRVGQYRALSIIVGLQVFFNTQRIKHIRKYLWQSNPLVFDIHVSQFTSFALSKQDQFETRSLRHMYGQGIEKNVEEAIKFYYKAAEGWYGLAQYLLGKFYAAGQFVDKDDQQVDK